MAPQNKRSRKGKNAITVIRLMPSQVGQNLGARKELKEAVFGWDTVIIYEEFGTFYQKRYVMMQHFQGKIRH